MSKYIKKETKGQIIFVVLILLAIAIGLLWKGADKKRPCMGCKDRHEACHGHCEAYKEYAEEVRKKRIFVINENKVHDFPPTVKYKKSSGCYVVSTSKAHKHRKGVR